MITFPRLGLSGRLGNQLWQIASTWGIARSFGVEARFPTNWPYRPYFSLPDELYADVTGIPSSRVDLVEHIPKPYRDYLLDLSLWARVAGDVRKFFQPSATAFAAVQQTAVLKLDRPILSLHVRRGDNVNNPKGFIPLRPKKYYDDALELALKTHKIASVVCFSDDPEWCEKNFGGRVSYYFHGRPRKKEQEEGYLTDPVHDWLDLFLMAGCDHHIISNSSYAWWGAWLSGDRTAITPWPWYGPELAAIDVSLCMPPEWTRVDHGPVDEDAVRRE